MVHWPAELQPATFVRRDNRFRAAGDGQVSRRPHGARGAPHGGSGGAAGDRAMVVFVVQREDAVAFGPHPTADPALNEALRRVHAAGVEIMAWRCRVSLVGSSITDRIDVML